MLWDDLLRKHNVQLPKSSGQCAPPKCQLSYYEENNAYSPPRTSWIWHPPPYAADGPWTTGENGDGWVEVMHKADPFDEHYGAWFLQRAQASGQISKHIAFDEQVTRMLTLVSMVTRTCAGLPPRQASTRSFSSHIRITSTIPAIRPVAIRS